MYKINEIKELIRTMDRSTIDELTIKGEGKQLLSLRRNRGQQFVTEESVLAEKPQVAAVPPAAPSPSEPINDNQAAKKEEIPVI